jgi:hypothetical protein
MDHITLTEDVDPTMAQMVIDSIQIHSVNNAPHLVHVVSELHSLLLSSDACRLNDRSDRRVGLVARRMMRNSAGYASSLEAGAQVAAVVLSIHSS